MSFDPCELNEEQLNNGPVFYNLFEQSNSTPGVCEKLFVAPMSWIKQLQHPSQGIVIEASHIFHDGYGFIELILAPDVNLFKTLMAGDKGSNAIAQQIEFFVAGSYISLHETIAAMMNTPLLVLVGQDCPQSWYFQLGNHLVNAWLEVGFETGTTVAGRKGFGGNFSYTSNMVWLYKGAIPIYDDEQQFPQDLIIDADGVFIESVAGLILYD